MKNYTTLDRFFDPETHEISELKNYKNTGRHYFKMILKHFLDGSPIVFPAWYSDLKAALKGEFNQPLVFESAIEGYEGEATLTSSNYIAVLHTLYFDTVDNRRASVDEVRIPPNEDEFHDKDSFDCPCEPKIREEKTTVPRTVYTARFLGTNVNTVWEENTIKYLNHNSIDELADLLRKRKLMKSLMDGDA